MDSNDSFHRRNQSTPLAIPLQDLNRPPDTYDNGQEDSAQRQRSLSERGRNLLRQRDSVSSRPSWSSRYEPIAESSPSPTRTQGRPPRLVTHGSDSAGAGPSQHHEEDFSPVEDMSAFQSAIGFAGLTFQGESSAPPPVRDSNHLSRPYHVGRTPSNGSNPYAPENTVGGGYFSPVYEDTAPLTAPDHLQPISGAGPSTPTAQSHDRTSFQSVRFLSPEASNPGARLGDELNNAEAGYRMSTSNSPLRGSEARRTRSLSPSTTETPLQRAGTIVRNMSQRVVNIASDPEVVERSLRRKSSMKQARLEGPPPLPAMPEYAHDGAGTPPPEKKPSHASKTGDPTETPASSMMNPLRGKSLGIFPPDNPLRLKLCNLLVHPITEPFILFLIIIQTILLAVDPRRNDFDGDERPAPWGSSWIDYALLGLFCIYTVETIVRTIVSGFIINPVEYSTINRQVGLKQAILDKGRDLFTPQRAPSVRNVSGPSGFHHQQPIIRSFTHSPMAPQLLDDPRQQQRARLAHRAYLRHSFNRLDFLAVISFWISFVMSITGVESSKHQYVFRMLSCLRILRLLLLTNGTTVILRSLKKAAPLLVHVAFLISFFWLLFAIIGVQSFKASLRRTCVWTNPENESDTWTSDQACGGYLDKSGNAQPWVKLNGEFGAGEHKGYLCPINSICKEGENPYNGTQSFDNIFQSLELVFVVMSSNTWSDIMYTLADSDYLPAALFFGAGIVILSLWLINLLIAVITSSFQVIREESKTSAFTGEQSEPSLDDEVEEPPKRKVSPLKRMWEKTNWFWIGIISYGLICQTLRSASMSPQREKFINTSETIVTLALLLEIVLRFVVDWRHFFRSKRNVADLLIAVITTIIQLPAIKNADEGRPYAWLTVFQIMRIYRVVMAVPLTRDLIVTVLGNVSGLLNLILFVFLLTFLAAILASQLFRGELPREDDSGEPLEVNFYSIYNSFLGMYQILSSENWTGILYNVTNYDRYWNTAWIGAAFLILWFVLANFIVLNMFIAVIQENFDVSEDEKRLQQVKAFLQRKDLGGPAHGNLSLSTIFKLGQHTGRRKDPLDFGSAATEMLLKDAVVRDFLDEPTEPMSPPQAHDQEHGQLRTAPTTIVRSGTLSGFWSRLWGMVKNREPNPFYSRLEFSRAYEDLDPRQMAKEVVSATERRKRAQREYLRKHPNYNVSLFIFRPSNPVRKLCQRIVGPGRGGDRIEGVAPSAPVWYAFSAFIYAAIVAMVLLACITTPLYQKEYFQTHEFSVRNWFVFTDMGFAILFTTEAVIKVIADGFFWTPNAYFRSSWGFIDGVVLVTLWINVGTSLYNEGQISRAVGAFKALRALRLLNVSDSARDTFHSVIWGGWKVVSAALVSLSLLIPFAIYGLNLFNGKMLSCNDGDSNIVNLDDCVGEFNNSPFNWDVWSPRRVSNPFYDFDNFGGSLFILFQIVSQEGWTDVMWAAQSITHRGQQPQPFASQGNAMFFIIFNLLGAVFVLTLFVSVFMRNYTEQTGVAYLTTDQRSWLELRKLLRQVSPSKRPSSTKRRETWEEWCYRRAVRKTGRWQRFITAVLIFHLILLCTEYDPGIFWWDRTRDYVFLALTMIYIVNIVIRIIGLTWARFRRSSWDVYSIFAVGGTFITTTLLLSDFKQNMYVQIHKLCLVSVVLLLIPRNNQLDQLFKTAAASLNSIANLMATWFVLFLVFAIALTQTFGLTKFNESETGNVNFRDVPKALILLFRMSIGEGWNQIMEDYATVTPPNCVVGTSYFDGDCGSEDWARFLFISWNLLSMYIFVNLFVSLIYESFSYVYQRSSGLSVISREEIRRFKQAWAEFDPNGTGFITKEQFPRLLGELSGVFEMRIYDGDFTVRNLIEDCSGPRRVSGLPVQGHEPAPEIDLAKLNRRLRDLPVDEIRRRRARMNIFYEEVLVSSDPDRGISFNALLRILAHYKVINDSKSLRLEEFLRRRARLQRVEEAVRRNVVIGFFDTLYWSRRFRRAMEIKKSGRMTAVPQFTVPEIFVDDEDMAHGHQDAEQQQQQQQQQQQHASLSPTFSAVDLSSIDSDQMRTTGTDMRSPSPPADMTLRSRANSIQVSPSQSPTRGTSPSVSPYHSRQGSEFRDWQFANALSRPPSPLEGDNMAVPGSGGRSRQNSSVSAADALEAFDNSAWGESIRRSFTLRRPPGR